MKIAFQIACFLLIVQTNMFCQETFYNYGKYKPGSSTLIFGDKVNIRESASTQSKVVDQLTIGTKVVIVEKSEETLTLNNYKEAWYKIKYNNHKTGYIWGGLLAKGYIERDISQKYSGKEKIILGLNKMENYSKIAEIRYCSNHGQIISSISYDALPISFGKEDNTLSYTVSASYIGEKGLIPPIGLFAIHYSYEACDYPNGEEYFYILNDKLHFAFTSLWTSNEFGSVYSDLKFPDDQDGEYNVVIETKKYTERNEEYVNEKTWESITKYIWSGRKFYKLPEIKIE